jgi:hypothetical protein
LRIAGGRAVEMRKGYPNKGKTGEGDQAVGEVACLALGGPGGAPTSMDTLKCW